MSYEWDNKKPTAQMLGRWQPFHDGHYALFEEIVKITGQVCIQIRDVQGVDDNPFDFEAVKKNIEERLNLKYENKFKIMLFVILYAQPQKQENYLMQIILFGWIQLIKDYLKIRIQCLLNLKNLILKLQLTMQKLGQLK